MAKDSKTGADLIGQIRSRYPSLSEGHKKVARFILDNLEVATFATLSELSDKVGVSDATFIRFARELGYSGFKEFRDHLADYIRKIIYLRTGAEAAVDQSQPILERVKKADMDFIAKTLDRIDEASFNQLIDNISAARQVYAMGWRISSFLAEFLVFQLRRIGIPATQVIRERRTLLEQVMDLGRGDLLIVFDLVMYSAEVFEAVEYLNRTDSGVTLVTVTNDPLAQIVQNADLSFFIDLAGHRDFSIISLTGPMGLINAIIEELIASNPGESRARLEKYEQIVLSSRRHAVVMGPDKQSKNN